MNMNLCERLMHVNKYVLIFFVCLIFLTDASKGEVYAEEPKIDAIGAILMDYKTGRVLWERNSNKSMANASTTKIMTAIYVIEKANLEDIVTVSKRAAAAPEVKMYLKTGEKIKLRYLMYALMLQSSNDAAVAIAEHVGGSVEEFCASMTKRAKELGARDSLFVTPNGLDSGDHHSTAYDMAVIARHALSNPQFVELINTSDIVVESDRKKYSIVNHNRLLNEYTGANGVKTGFTGKAGHCFVGSAKRDDMQLISVVLASGWGNRGKAQKWIDTKRLLDYGFKMFNYQNIVTQGTIARELAVERSRTESVGVSYKEGLMLPLSEAEASSYKIEVDLPASIKAPVDKGQKIGTASIFIGGSIYKEIDLCTEAAATRHDFKTSLEKLLNSWLELGTKSDVKVNLPEVFDFSI